METGVQAKRGEFFLRRQQLGRLGECGEMQHGQENDGEEESRHGGVIRRVVGLDKSEVRVYGR